MVFTVAVLAYDGLSPFHLAVPGVVFGELQAWCGVTDWTVNVCGHNRGPLRTSDGYDITVDHGLDVFQAADLAIVPSWRDPDLDPPPELLDALVAAHDRGAVVAGLCLGAFVVAAAGLLDNRRATTHWRAAPRLAERHPLVQVDSRVLYIDDGDVVTSAGTAASIDACLHIVRRRLGSSMANQVARGLVAAPYRGGGQAQYIERSVPVIADDDPLAVTVEWALEHLTDALSVHVLAAHAHMSDRTFERTFFKSYGSTPAAWVRSQRLREAQVLLETTKLPMDQVAARCGFGSSVAMRQNFVAELGVPPAAYRRSFQQQNGAAGPTGGVIALPV